MSNPKLTDTLNFPSDLNVTRSLFGVGIVGLLASGVGYFMEHDQFFFSYLVSFTFFSSIALASLFFVMLQHLTRSEWSAALRRIPEAMSSNIWIWGLFIIPIFLGMHSLFHWTHADAVANDPVLQGKQPYSNTPFFIIRQFIYFGSGAFWDTGCTANQLKWTRRATGALRRCFDVPAVRASSSLLLPFLLLLSTG
ncbi:MAG: hypothetical protein U5J63_11510 [Fodinibius sp.]|nr:hypothetical protein [Fodinibius sp.]